VTAASMSTVSLDTRIRDLIVNCTIILGISFRKLRKSR
jgi:hypothetical protein